MKIYLSNGALLIFDVNSQFARFFLPYLTMIFLFATIFFFRIYVIRECTNTPNKVDRTESERFSRRRLPRHERQNRILQNILWHARMWPVRHKRWLTRHTQPRQLRQRGTQWLAVISIVGYINSFMPNLCKETGIRKKDLFLY